MRKHAAGVLAAWAVAALASTLGGTVADPAGRSWFESAAQMTRDASAAERKPGKAKRRPRRKDVNGCRYAGNRPSRFSDRTLERATRCLINRERKLAGRKRVRASRKLRIAATRHAADMVRRRYFSHFSPEGHTQRDRVRAAGYLDGASSWTLTEVLAWGYSPAPTPARTVKMWMDSPGHRAAMLHPDVRRVGIAMIAGTPAGHRRGATWTGNFGHKRR